MLRATRDGPGLQITAARCASLSVDAALFALASRRGGLSEKEALERLSHHGANVLPRPEPRPIYARIAAKVLHFFALLLWTAAALAWVAGMPQLSVAIVAVVAINGVFSSWQEHQAERAVEALEALLPQQVLVRRDGIERVVPASSVVPGDILVLSEGELICADARVISHAALRVDLSSLTGESRAVPRSAHAVTRPGSNAASFPNLVFAGTSVASGRGEAVVYATAASTEFGRIAGLTHRQRERPSPLERELAHVTRFVTVFAVFMGACFFLFGATLGGLTVLAGFLFAVGIIVANVPEGLLPTLSLSLALGVRRMAKRKALVKRLSAVEALGATTVILTDKTGTLTENTMTVRAIWTGGVHYRVGGGARAVQGDIVSDGPGGVTRVDEVELILRTAALCCDARVRLRSADSREFETLGDPTEVAILIGAAKAGLVPDVLARFPRLEELPFDSVRKRMTTIHRIGDERYACVKGAPDHVLERSVAVREHGRTEPLTSERRQQIEDAQAGLGDSGLRVLGVALRSLGRADAEPGSPTVDEIEQELVFLGLVAMEDPPRPGVVEAIAACRAAGIRVQMITGDDGTTALAIGREIGLYGNDARIVLGSDLDGITDDALVALLEERHLLFARVSPEHKLRLVGSHQRRGEVVAVTGDGVNDAPALRRADIGVAMGETGTDVAREAADMVLVDDDFSNIVSAIEAGRGVYDNVHKFVTYIFASNIPEIVPFVVFVLFDVPLPLTVMQILAVDLGTDLLPALALGAEPVEKDVMRRPPRSRSARLLDAPTLLRAYGWLGVIEAALSLFAFFASFWFDGWRPGEPLPDAGPVYARATTASLAGIISCQIGNVFACRSRSLPALAVPLTKNPLLIAGLLFEITLLALLIYVPPLADIFGLEPLTPRHWLLLSTFGPTLLACEELRKAAMRRFGAARGETAGGGVHLAT